MHQTEGQLHEFSLLDWFYTLKAALKSEDTFLFSAKAMIVTHPFVLVHIEFNMLYNVLVMLNLVAASERIAPG